MAKRVRFFRGQAAIALSLAIPMMVGAACIGADMRALHSSSVRLQRAADAAVLSGAAYLPTNPALAESAARSKAQMKGIRQNEIIYDRPASDRRSITMVVERKVPYRFARLLGLSQSLVIVKAEAGISSFQSASGVLPIGIQYDAHYAVYQPIVLKIARLRDAGPDATWKPLAMGTCESCDARQNYRRNLINGYESPVSVGDTVSVEANDQTAATYSGLAARLISGTQSDPGETATNYATGDPRRIEVPMVDFNADGGNNGGSTVSVHGFAVLWITSVDAKGSMSAEFLDFMPSKGFSRSEEGPGTLTPLILQERERKFRSRM
jgi:hypothetical protein